MKSTSSSSAVAGTALVLGGIVGVAVAIEQVGMGLGIGGRQPPRPIAPLAARGRVAVDWIDRGLLNLAKQEVDTDLVSESGDAGPALDADLTPVGEPLTLIEQRDQLYRMLSRELGVPERALAEIRAAVESSARLGQGNPDVSVHPVTREQCRAARTRSPTVGDDEPICGLPNMVVLFDPEREEPGQAKLCIDQYEFPNIACEYPVVWVRASEASRICRLMDKRLCDAHEWEGACAGKLRAATEEYQAWAARLNAEFFHNQGRERVWATGYPPDGRTCGTGARKSPGCFESSWERCGTNSYPAGAFPRCVSPFGVYDLHGNVAEHMNLPLNETQLGSHGGHGETEMKGSWFAFDGLHPHSDDCRWRAPAWHATSVESETSHFNYHLGFRCCRDLD